MCLFIKDGCHIEIAKKDIVTFKNVIERDNCWEPSYMGGESYRYNEVLTARRSPYKPKDTIKHLKVVSSFAIIEGFHSRVKKTPYYCNKICIIPKGSELCYGDMNDVVSLRIIVFKNRLYYLKYKLSKLLKKKVE